MVFMIIFPSCFFLQIIADHAYKSIDLLESCDFLGSE